MDWESIWNGIDWLLGLSADELNVREMATRAAVVFVAALIIVRTGEKRFFGENTAFDLILGIILGSVISRAINGSAPFFPTLVAGFVLVGMHWLLASLAFRWHWFGVLVKGQPRLLVRDGEIQWDAMRKSSLSERDLRLALRTQAGTNDLSRIQEAHLERSGEVSIIPRKSEPKVVEVAVESGVQTVRIEIE